MLSVLIINSEIYERYSRYAYFFNWFEDNRNIVVCPWNKSYIEDDDMDTLLLQLLEIVKNEPQWNAYIIDGPFESMAHIEADFENKTQYAINPYERAAHADYEIENDPLLKLVYFLGGRGVEELAYIKKFQFRAVRPNQIFLITPRIFEDLEMQKSFLQWRIADDTEVLDGERKLPFDGSGTNYEADPEEILKNQFHSVLLYSNFWERYEYPPNCRFLVYDMPNRNNQSYDDAWFTLWLCVLSLVLNTFPSAELGPYKLYVINALISDEGVADFLNKFYTLLLDAKEAVDKEMDNEVKAIKQESADITSGDFTDTAPVYVTMPEVDLDRMFADHNEYSLTKDRPIEDEEAWRSYMKTAKDTENKLFKAVERGKNDAIRRMQTSFLMDLPMLKRRKITEYAIEDITERMNDLEIEMVSLNTGYKASRTEFDKRQKKAEADVIAFLKKRLRSKSAVAIIFATVLVYLIGFVPYVIHSIQNNITSFLVAILVSVGACCLLAVSGILALKFLYSRLKLRLNDYNGVMHESISDVTAGTKIQSQYLSDLLDYMEKYQLITNAKIDRRHIERINRLGVASDRFENAIYQCKMLARLRHISLARWQGAPLMGSLSTDPSVPIYLHEDVKGVRMALNRSKNALDVPFPFVDGLLLAVETLFECEAYQKRPDPSQAIQPEETEDA